MDLKAKPFFLDDDSINWIETTKKIMTTKEKIGQLFCTMGMSDAPAELDHLTKDIQVGGIMYRPTNGVELLETHRYLQSNSKIPLLIAANLEAGGHGALLEGTNYGMPMGVAATNNKKRGYQLGKVSCSEGAAVGINWAFAPIVDIDMNFRNPITNLRTFGSDIDTVIKMSQGYLKAADEEGLAVSIKHYPGDGVDERDQHLLTSVNDLSANDWLDTYGKVYRTLIEDGAKTVMVGHIAQPDMVQHVNPDATLEEMYTPGSLSKELLNDVLRDELGFNGLTVTDASLMVGFTSFMERKKSVPLAIANGCDMFLFNKNIDEDFSYMLAGYEEGIITDERLNEAVTRILATKASLELHTKQKNKTLVPKKETLKDRIAKKEYQIWAKECADESITLVKDTQNLLPIHPKKHKRVYLNVIERSIVAKSEFTKKLIHQLEDAGFDVTLNNRLGNIDIAKMMAGDMTAEMMASMADMMKPTSEFTQKYDLALIVANMETLSNEVDIRLKFDALSNDIPWFVNEIPTLFISFANPYHLLDVPMIKTVINSYTGTEATISATLNRILGKEEFKGVSPVDPFCGRKELTF